MGLFLRVAASGLLRQPACSAKGIMKADCFRSLRFPFLRYLPSILLLVWLAQQFALGQTQGGSQSPAGDAQSWTATSQQQLPSNLDPTRTSETHTESGGRTVDHQSIEHMGMDGRYAPFLDVQKETVRVDANTVRTVERAFGRDSDGRKTLVQVTEEEKRTLPGGEVKVVRTTSDPDANGALQIVQRQTQDTTQINPNVQETKTTVLTPSSNGGLVASVESTERQTKTNEHDVEFRKSTSVPDSNGEWQLSEVREGTVKSDGKDGTKTKEERVLRPGTDGNLSVVERTVSKESANGAGEKRDTVETYSTFLPGAATDGSLHLEQRVTTVHRKAGDGAESTESQVQQRNPAEASDRLQVTEEAIDIVRPGRNGATKETQTIRSLDSNGSLGIVSVDTRTQNNSPAIQVDIAPAKTAQAGTSH
jgi:hypothetical protein